MPKFLSDSQWDLIYVLGDWLENREGNDDNAIIQFVESFSSNQEEWKEYGSSDDILELEVPLFNNKLSEFQILILQKLFRPDKLMFGMQNYVRNQIGSEYADPSTSSMEVLFNDSDKITPIIFVLSQGADPSLQLIKFAENKGFKDKLDCISLGQGQNKQAEDLIQKGQKEGRWVLLQNCHLYKSWMVVLEQIVNKFGDEADSIHEDFRLFLTSMPAIYFPVSILQNGLKLTTEPPRGLRANLTRSYAEMTEVAFKDCKKFDEWKKLLFGLSFFHAIVQERRKFGPLGFNIRYEFNDSDLETSITMLRAFLNDDNEIPWDAMNFMTGHINYGGRVTDDWDRKLLLCILKRFFSIEVLEEGYVFSESGKYFIPDFTTLQEFKTFIDQLPATEDPEIFGLNQNANIIYQKQESLTMLNTILEIQPRVTGSGSGMSSDEIIQEQVKELEELTPEILDLHHCAKDLFKINNLGLMHCLSTVLCQEIERFNKLLVVMKLSLRNLDDAIQGLVLMSQELDDMYGAFLKNKVPPNWESAAYPSLKPLGSWIKDLVDRVEFMRNWLENGHPKCFWLSGFFFPHGFMTGSLQTFARKHQEAIDLIKFSFKVMTVINAEDIYEPPDDGMYINGLFIEGAKWNFEHEIIEDQAYVSQPSSNSLGRDAYFNAYHPFLAEERS